jgi:hypothetical protein
MSLCSKPLDKFDLAEIFSACNGRLSAQVGLAAKFDIVQQHLGFFAKAASRSHM